MNSVEEIFKKIEKKILNSEAELQQYNALFKFNISGEQGGSWLVDLRPESLGVRKEDCDADCIISSSDTDFIKLINKEMRPESAILRGKLKLSGDIKLAMQLSKIFK
ncbi:MAG: SCP2 sterol-binding domain-containing protein [Thermodesulfobacteriota bacterium]